MSNNLSQRTLYVVRKRDGVVLASAQGMMNSMLHVYALMNITSGKVGILVLDEDDEIEKVYEGRPDRTPRIVLTEKNSNGRLPIFSSIIKDTNHIRMKKINEILKSA